MNAEDLKALARSAEPLSDASAAVECCERVVAYNDFVSRFRERVVRARNSLVLGQAVEPELERELRLLAQALPGMRHKVEAGAKRVPPRKARVGA